MASLGASLTVSVSHHESPVKSIDDLSKQYTILYSTMENSVSAAYFERMANIEQRFFNIWKDLILNQSLSPFERTKFAVWEYPMTNKYTKIWQTIQKTGLLNSWEEGARRVINSTAGASICFFIFFLIIVVNLFNFVLRICPYWTKTSHVELITIAL